MTTDMTAKEFFGEVSEEDDEAADAESANEADELAEDETEEEVKEEKRHFYRVGLIHPREIPLSN